MLHIEKYSISIDSKLILNNISVQFEKGKIYALMGPNGSGKSTLALSLAGSPNLSLSKDAKVWFKSDDITQAKPEDRARKGLFITLQSPPAISGVTVFQLLRTALSRKIKPFDLRKKLFETAQDLSISKELLSRSLNEGFSGGERKKMEILQLALLDPDCIFFDEIDTGVDVDALRTIAGFLQKFKTPEKTFIFITHNTKILEYLKPNFVIVLKNGEITRTGDNTLVQYIEKNGYDSL